MANPRPCGHGTVHTRYDILEVDTGLSGGAVAVGEFTCSATTQHSISDSAVRANSQVLFFPTNAGAGLTLRSNSCYVTAISAGSFRFDVSASGTAGDTFGYIALSRS